MREISTPGYESDLPFSQAIEHAGTIYVSGQGPLDGSTGAVVGESPYDQAIVTLENIQSILEAGGSSLNRLLRTAVYLRDMRHYEAVNEAFHELLSRPYPARTAIEVADLPVEIHVEIDAIAAVA